MNLFLHKWKIHLPVLLLLLPKVSFFPHISRIISAFPLKTGIRFLFWLIVFITLPLNLFHTRVLGFTPFDTLRYSTLADPQNSSLHKQLAEYYSSQNQMETAEREYLLADTFYRGNPHFSPLRLWKRELQKEEKEKKFWQQIHTRHPAYFYSSLKLAEFALQEGQKKEAKKYINEVLSSYPTNSIALKLKSRLD